MVSKESVLNKRFGLGAGIGGLAGFFFGGPVGGIAGAAIGGALAHMAPDAKRGEMTPERKMVFHNMMNKEKTPEELREMADVFEGEGFSVEANMLRGRAGLRELPPEVREQRKDIYRRAMSSDSPEEIREFAAVFDTGHAYGSAESLRKHADAVEAAHAAGKSCKPMEDTKQIDLFGAKLAKAVVHFGPDSDQAKAAARNFIRARGVAVSDEEVAKVLVEAAAELEAEQPDKAPASPASQTTSAGAPGTSGATT